MSIVLKEYHGLKVDEIAERMNDSKRNVYFYISEAKKIGMQYRKDTQ
jgi:DNA-directed RNA polymerase specialized sigma24 family protein